MLYACVAYKYAYLNHCWESGLQITHNKVLNIQEGRGSTAKSGKIDHCFYDNVSDHLFDICPKIMLRMTVQPTMF